MRILIISFVTAASFFWACSEDEIPVTPTPVPPKVINLQEELSLINWNELSSGKICYQKFDTLLLIDCNTRTIKKLSESPYLLNMKWNPDGTMITGMEAVNTGLIGTEYLLKGIDTNGVITDLKTNIYFNTPYYDWFPDGRVAKIAENKYVLVDNNFIPLDGLLPTVGYGKLEDIACKHDGNTIMLSLTKWDSISSGIIKQLYEINVYTFSRDLILSGSTLPGMKEFKFKSDDSKLLFLNITPGVSGFWIPGWGWSPGSEGSVQLYQFPSTLLKDGATGAAWSLDKNMILMAYDGDIYIKDLDNSGYERKIFSKATVPVWGN